MSDLEVDDRVWRALTAALEGLGKKHVRVGLLEKSGGGDVDENGFTLAARGAVHEFGSTDGTIPERRWIRGTFETYEKELIEMQARISKQFFSGDFDIEKALSMLGVWASNKVKYHVKNDTLTPALKQATIDRKGSDRPLIDTALMVNSVNYEITDAKSDGVDAGSSGL